MLQIVKRDTRQGIFIAYSFILMLVQSLRPQLQLLLSSSSSFTNLSIRVSFSITLIQESSCRSPCMGHQEHHPYCQKRLENFPVLPRYIGGWSSGNKILKKSIYLVMFDCLKENIANEKRKKEKKELRLLLCSLNYKIAKKNFLMLIEWLDLKYRIHINLLIYFFRRKLPRRWLRGATASQFGLHKSLRIH